MTILATAEYHGRTYHVYTNPTPDSMFRYGDIYIPFYNGGVALCAEMSCNKCAVPSCSVEGSDLTHILDIFPSLNKDHPELFI